MKLVIVDEPMETPLKWECLRVIECSQQSQLQKMVQGVLNIFTGKGGVVLLLYSCVMTRGCVLCAACGFVLCSVGLCFASGGWEARLCVR